MPGVGIWTIFNSLWKAPCVLLSIILHLRQIWPRQNLKEFPKKPKPPPPQPHCPASQSYSRTQFVALVSVESCLKEKVLLAMRLESKHSGPCNECGNRPAFCVAGWEAALWDLPGREKKSFLSGTPFLVCGCLCVAWGLLLPLEYSINVSWLWKLVNLMGMHIWAEWLHPCKQECRPRLFPFLEGYYDILHFSPL